MSLVNCHTLVTILAYNETDGIPRRVEHMQFDLRPVSLTSSGPNIRASLTSTSKLNEINYAALQCFR